MRAFVAHRRRGECVGPGGARPGARRRARSSSTSSGSGVCGTDVEFFTGEMAYLHDGHARLPDAARARVVPARVAAVGAGVDPAWLGRRVMGDTMLG